MNGASPLGDKTKTTREAILDAAEAIMVEQGYAAVTFRLVEERAGLKSKLVHYHFKPRTTCSSRSMSARKSSSWSGT